MLEIRYYKTVSNYIADPFTNKIVTRVHNLLTMNPSAQWGIIITKDDSAADYTGFSTCTQITRTEASSFLQSWGYNIDQLESTI